MKRLRQLLNWRFRNVIAININMYRFHFHSVHMLCRRNKPQTLTAIQEALMLYPKKFVFVIFGQLKNRKYISVLAFAKQTWLFAVCSWSFLFWMLCPPRRSITPYVMVRLRTILCYMTVLNRANFSLLFRKLTISMLFQCIKSIMSSRLSPVKDAAHKTSI